ncbi:hypothetical protein JYU34_014849 [Plutella xylostella]|uniref:PiggyBac transposable element-derived protein domain-containing protein n=1 Tax=Plutella xylostella TaxID=51655 RepID=A0ABQ7QAA7_PLUXY|nr:hypothetical protein JYU34_014849 [Plutella xylostella]
MPTLKSRRILLGAMMLYNLCRHRFDSMELINSISYRVPRRGGRQRAANPHQLFASSSCRTNAGKRAPLHRLVATYNQLFNDADVFTLTPYCYKKHITETLNNLHM